MNRGRHNLVARLRTKVLHLYFRLSRGLTLGVRAVVRSENGKFLLVRHTYLPGWHFPGGGIERSETAAEALARELRQETGLELHSNPKLHGIFFNRAVGDHDHVLVYLCDTKGSSPANYSSLEIAEIRFFGLDELPPDIDAGTSQRINEIVRDAKMKSDW
ncbi:8-oxo-dGTP diphosphatase [Altererythrobacter insulae]|nr:8-oxo-dGTP diphosphatase [Altererythrobacter insulae]